jgi:DNA-binding NarL/FixJ family response regulator
VFSISRAGRGDYSDEDVETATRIQPLLIAVHWQKRVLGRNPMPRDAAKAFNLTGREVAVLHLLATGRTSGAIASALGCTGRTVEKHLEHLYRKLHVGDRVSALRVAEEESLIGVALHGPWEA